jgi:hypothetical protein
MSVKEKEALADEICLHQPHLLASCLVQARLGVEPAAVEFLLNILLVCYQSMKESGLQWSVITEDEQGRQRWIGAVQFSEHAAGSAADGAREQYASQHPEQPLLAFVLSETAQWLGAISNCIAGAPVSSVVHG